MSTNLFFFFSILPFPCLAGSLLSHFSSGSHAQHFIPISLTDPIQPQNTLLMDSCSVCLSPFLPFTRARRNIDLSSRALLTVDSFLSIPPPLPPMLSTVPYAFEYGPLNSPPNPEYQSYGNPPLPLADRHCPDNRRRLPFPLPDRLISLFFFNLIRFL